MSAVPEGPYNAVQNAGGAWDVLDSRGYLIARITAGEDTARLMAASWLLEEALQAMLLACPVKEGGTTHRMAKNALAVARRTNVGN